MIRFRKPKLEEMVTQEYHQAYAAEQMPMETKKKVYSLRNSVADSMEDDDISVHCGADVDPGSHRGSRQGSLLSRLSNKLKPATPDQLSLLDNPDTHDLESVRSTRM